MSEISSKPRQKLQNLINRGQNNIRLILAPPRTGSTLIETLMKNKQLVLLKLGGSLITDKNKTFAARREVIIRLGKEIKFAMRKFSGKLIIAHGSGSFGHPIAKKYKIAEGVNGRGNTKGVARVAEAAIRINRIVIECLLKAGLPVVSFAPASLMVAEDKLPVDSFVEPISQSLKRGLIPVLYGDIIFDRKRGWCIFSSEKILGVFAKAFLKSFTEIKVFYCGNTDGVYDENGKTIKIITPESFVKLREKIKGSTAADVTGGMLHKVEEAVMIAAKLGIETLIFSGRNKGQLRPALEGKYIDNSTRITIG